MENSNVAATCGPPLDSLNERCSCASIDRRALAHSLESQLAGSTAEIGAALRGEFFADVPLFVRHADMAAMEQVVRAIDAVARMPAYLAAISAWMPPIGAFAPGPLGAFMGYDFHLTNAGPRLIEINTNAGGAFLNAELARAQRACCPEVERSERAVAKLEGFGSTVIAMFESEWRRQRGAGRPGRIAIVDDDPPRQPLYPEFRLAQHLFAAHGIDAVIVDPQDLALAGRELLASGRRVDLVYNRLVDFALGAPEHAALRDAYLGDVVVVTPGPRAHAVFADKRNLAVLGDAEWLRQAGADEDTARLLSTAIPATAVVAPDKGEQLWQSRKELFFKPVMGYGSKGVYRGASVTRGVFAQILSGGYVAQRYVAPSERLIEVAGEARRLKVDVRLYTYGGDVLLSAARMYRGQATNLRTPSGGFAPVYEV